MKFRRWRTLHLFLLFLALASVGCAGSERADLTARTPKNHPSIVFMTDFGTATDAVAICKAVILQILPDARIMDITHQVTPYSIEEGAQFLAGVTPYYPPDTVFLVVVDPGVGTSRKAIVVKSKKQQFFVLPDNGLITPVADRDGIASAREITSPAWMIGGKVSSTFHGRDIFSPTAAHLAAGEDWTTVGPEVHDLVRLQPRVAAIDNRGIRGEVIGLDDPYGSLITDIAGEDFNKLGYALGDKVTITIAQKAYTMPYVKTFMDVAVGQPLLYIDSRGRVGIALNERNFSKTYRISPLTGIFVPRKKE